MTASRKQRIRRQIGRNLREIRMRKQLSRVQLARAMGCSDVMMRKYELGLCPLSYLQIWKLAKLLDVSMLAFFAGVIKPL